MAELQFRASGFAAHAARRLRRFSQPSLPLSVPLLGALLLVAAVYSIQSPGEISITFPAAGSVTSETFVAVSGTVKNHRVSQIQLIANGSPRTVAVNGGKFSSNVPLLRGENALHALPSGAMANITSGSKIVRFTANLPQFAIWTELTWEGAGDIDLHLYLPNGEHCYFRQRKTPSGAWLDIDTRDRDGPEHIIMEKALPGTYRLSVHYFAPTEGARAVPWRVTTRLKEDRIQRSYSGTLTAVNEVQIVDTFSFP